MKEPQDATYLRLRDAERVRVAQDIKAPMPVKTYHFPDWSRHPKGSSLTSWAICGQKVADGPNDGHWFPMGLSVVNCETCLSIQASQVAKKSPSEEVIHYSRWVRFCACGAGPFKTEDEWDEHSKTANRK